METFNIKDAIWMNWVRAIMLYFKKPIYVHQTFSRKTISSGSSHLITKDKQQQCIIKSTNKNQMYEINKIVPWFENKNEKQETNTK